MLKIFQKCNQIPETRSCSYLTEKLFVFYTHSERYGLLNNSNKKADHGAICNLTKRHFQVSWSFQLENTFNRVFRCYVWMVWKECISTKTQTMPSQTVEACFQ